MLEDAKVTYNDKASLILDFRPLWADAWINKIVLHIKKRGLNTTSQTSNRKS